MSVQSENIIWSKYNLFTPQSNRISKKAFHGLYLEYKKHPEKKQQLLEKLKSMSKHKTSTGGKIRRTKKVSNKRRHKRSIKHRW